MTNYAVFMTEIVSIYIMGRPDGKCLCNMMNSVHDKSDLIFTVAHRELSQPHLAPVQTAQIIHSQKHKRIPR